jgi:uncharacterized protein YcaQ
VATLDDLRRFAVSRAFPPPASLTRAVDALGFVQADPIRAPARAQDLTLRHRVDEYRAGDLARLYSTLGIEEDIFINYGFVTRWLQALMHPRSGLDRWSPARKKRVEALLAFVRERGEAHPRAVDRHFSHGRVTNYWGGSSSATTHLLEAMHYRGLLRVTRREDGIRIYGPHEHGPGPADRAARLASIDRLVDVVVRKYAPLPAASLSTLVSRLRHAAPQWQGELKAALKRAKRRLPHAEIEGIDWYWPEGEMPGPEAPQDVVRLLAPFDPLVWDRRRFEMLWGWAYRFEAYTPVAKRQRGYYALPLLWRDRVVGWGNISVKPGKSDALVADLGYVASKPPRGPAFRRELDAELDRLRLFLIGSPEPASGSSRPAAR